MCSCVVDESRQEPGNRFGTELGRQGHIDGLSTSTAVLARSTVVESTAVFDLVPDDDGGDG